MLLTSFKNIAIGLFSIALYGQKSCTEDPKQRLKRRTANLPKPRSRKRREVSLSYNPAINGSSPFLTRLPLEIRRQIYAYVLGNHLVHLLITPARLAHVCCSYSTLTDFTRACYPQARGLIVPEPIPIPPSEITIGLLLTCRQIYVEAFPALYASNVFDVDDLSAFNLFARNISLRGLSLIRSLHLRWVTHFPPLQDAETKPATQAPYDDATYLQFWHIVASQMLALTELRVAINGTWWTRTLDLQHPWVQPVKQVKGLEVFELEIVEPLYPISNTEEPVETFAAELKRILCRRRE